jgi:hypothetical protein
VPTCGFAICRPLHRRLEIILVVPANVRSGLVHRAPDPAGPCPASSLTSHRRRAAPIPWLRSWAAKGERNHPQRMNWRGQPSSQAAQTDTPRQQLTNLDLACPGSDCRSTHPYGADQARWTPAVAGSNPTDPCRGPVGPTATTSTIRACRRSECGWPLPGSPSRRTPRGPGTRAGTPTTTCWPAQAVPAQAEDVRSAVGWR